MKGVIILGSARGDGNTALVVEELRRLTNFDVIDLLKYEINYYDYEHSHLGDDFIPLMEQITLNYDLIIFATPVYWYTMSAQMKTFFDRISDLTRVKKELGRKLRGKSMAMMSCGHANDLVEGFELPFRHSANYLGMKYVGDLYTWNDGSSELSSEVKEKITDFANTLLAMP